MTAITTNTPTPETADDAAIIAAWARRQAALAAYITFPADGPEEEEEALGAQMDAEEETIRASVATTRQGVHIQLLCAMYRLTTSKEDHDALTRGALAEIDDEALDWDGRMVLAALRSTAEVGAMAGIIHVDGAASVAATTDHMTLSFESGGDVFKFLLPRHTAILFKRRVEQQGWPVLCEPNGEVVPLYAGCAGCPRHKKARR